MEDEFASLVARHVGRRMRRRRRDLDLTQEALMFDAGVHRTGISLVENGITLVRLDTLILLARALDVTESELLAGLDEDEIERRRRRPYLPPGHGR